MRAIGIAKVSDMELLCGNAVIVSPAWQIGDDYWVEMPADCPKNGCEYDDHPCVHWNYGECLIKVK